MYLTKEISKKQKAAFSSRLLAQFFSRIIRHGTLIIRDPSGNDIALGAGSPVIAVRVADSLTAWRILLNPDLALGEAYMQGRFIVENASIYDFLHLCLTNTGRGADHPIRHLRQIIRRAIWPLHQQNSLHRAFANAAHHYDLPGSLYDLFLDSDRQYSCAYFLSPRDTLEQAQLQKKNHLLAKLLLKPGQRVLDIGCGWGGLALYLAQKANADVTGLTLSTEQHAYASERAASEGMGEHVRYLLKDYRQEKDRYDRIVSVGMLEHVGQNNYLTYFRKIKELLHDDGVALIHTIGRTDGPGTTNAWLNKYIFPGGYSPALSELVAAIERAGLYITDIEILRLHYADTLKAWRQNFQSHRRQVRHSYGEEFCRMWEFYLAGCEASFRNGSMVNFQIQLSKKLSAIPLTRNYMNIAENSLH